ncbi:MAG: DoxX family protein [Planctomycetota bacterium]
MKLFDPGPSGHTVSLGLLLHRLAFAGLMLSHGIPKITGFLKAKDTFPDPLGIGSTASLLAAIGAEGVCAFLVLIGFATRLAALPIVFTMGVAAFVVHAGDPWQKKELALAYAAAFLVLFFTGAGRYSVDARGRRD